MKRDRPARITPESIAAFNARRAWRDRELARYISAWARTHERCQLPGCRRNGRCLHPGDCRYVRSLPPITNEERYELFRPVRQALLEDRKRRERLGQVGTAEE